MHDIKKRFHTLLRDPENGILVMDIFGTQDMDLIASSLDAFCRNHLGSPIASCLSLDISVGAGVDLALHDGRALFMLMGLPGSGKTTLARRLEAERPALHLAPDLWMARIVGDGYDAERREAVQAVQLDLAARVLSLGCDVILEFGFFRRAERNAAQARAQAVGAEAHLIFLDPPFSDLLQRLEACNLALPPDTFPVSKEHLELCES
jgi:predicted kinase